MKVERFSTSPSDPAAARKFKLWLRNFEFYLDTISTLIPNKLEVLFLHIDSEVAELIVDCTDYATALSTLKTTYIKETNEIYARHLLSTRVQANNESIDDYLTELHKLTHDCKFKSVTAAEHRDVSVRDAFIRGLKNSTIRARLLENTSLKLSEAVLKARSLEQALVRSDSYSQHTAAAISEQPTDSPTTNTTDTSGNTYPTDNLDNNYQVAAAANIPANKGSCYNCGNARHPSEDRRRCPAKDVTCRICNKLGHFQKVCRSRTFTTNTSTNPRAKSTSAATAVLASSSTNLASTKGSAKPVVINGTLKTVALLDTGSSENFIRESVVTSLGLHISESQLTVEMACTNLKIQIKGVCYISLQLGEENYSDLRVFVMQNPVADLILGVPFLEM